MLLRLIIRATCLRHSFRSERGQDILEYAILSGAIVFAAAAALYSFFGPETFEVFVEKVQACIAFDGDNCNPDV